MAGNAFEITRAATRTLAASSCEGGAWYYDFIDARPANRSPGDPTLRDTVTGVRVCASFSPR